MDSARKLNIRWTDDCQGKKDFDGEIIKVSTRYWPAGGGFHLLDSNGFQGNESRPEIKPSAKSGIFLNDEDETELASREFEGETEDDVMRQVETWVNEHSSRIMKVVLEAFK